jgi:hypothetical protein
MEVRLMRASRVPGVLCLLVGSLACGPSAEDVTLSTVPTPPDYVSGGDVLVRVDAGPGVDLGRVTVGVNGVSAEVVQAPAPPDRLGREQNAVLALVKGLANGANEVVASVGSRQIASLTVTNYPAQGPIFSGAHLEPYFCLAETAPGARGPNVFAIGNGESLDGAGHGPGCSLPTRVDYVYLPAGEGADLQPLAVPGKKAEPY